MTCHSASSLPAALTVVIGVVLVLYMVVAEGEPGAIPLLLVGGGVSWHLIMRTRRRAHTDSRAGRPRGGRTGRGARSSGKGTAP